MIDFHCHLDLYPNPQKVIDECKAKGVYVLSVTTVPSAWEGTSALSKGCSRIKTALGLHPQLAKDRGFELALFQTLLPVTKYVGEIGLDGTPGCKAFWQEQVMVFSSILEMCEAAGGRIMTIHSRNAASDVLDLLERKVVKGTPILHWFSGSVKELSRAIELGCWFSVGPAMIKGLKGQSLISKIPKDRILTESDGPFVQVENRAALPQDVGIVYQRLAHIWGIPNTTVTAIIHENLKTLLSRNI